jgi:protein-disulfide isomerase
LAHFGAVALLSLSAFVALPALAADEARPTDLVVGDAKATCTIIEYSSLACPHCAHFHETVYPALKKDYIDTGKVRMIFRDFPLNKPGFYAAKVARCSGPLKRFGFVGLYFQTQKSWVKNDPEMTEELAAVARRGGMSREQFDTCLADKSVEQAVLADNQEGATRFQVESTPSFILNGKKADVRTGTVDEFKGFLKSECGL